MTTKKYQPETTHVCRATEDEYAIIDEAWRYYRDGAWRVSMRDIENLQDFLVPIKRNEDQPKPEPSPQLSGGSCNYYMVDVKKPTTPKDAYTVECNDLIEALGLTWQEANIYKEIFRTANERTHGNGKDGNNPKRAAEKVLFFAIRHAILNGVDIEKFTSEINLK